MISMGVMVQYITGSTNSEVLDGKSNNGGRDLFVIVSSTSR